MALSGRSSSLFLLCLVVGLTAVHCAEADVADGVDPYDDQIERAFLIVHKKIFEPDVVIGKNMTVIVSIYNAGGRYAVLQAQAPLPFLCRQLLFDAEHRFLLAWPPAPRREGCRTP